MFTDSPRNISLSPCLTDKAHSIAANLRSHTPAERALIWHQAELIWEAQASTAQPNTEFAKITQEDHELVAHCLCLAKAFPRLSPDARLALLDLAQSMLDDERFERLIAEATDSA